MMQRRKFLKNLAWISGGLILTRCTPARAIAANGQLLKGTVSANGKGLKNVVVSDGYSVVTTDKNGRYELIPNKDAVAVFVSTPSGYHFPQEKSIARHYTLMANTGGRDVNFELTPLDRDDNEHSFIIWADPQVKNAKDVQKMMEESVPDVQKLVAEAGPGALLHGIAVGDIVWDDLQLFADYDRGVEQMGIPFFQVLGNHDMDFRKGGDETSDDTFHLTYGPTYYSFNRGQVHYAVIDNVRYLGTERDYDGYITQHQLDWLQKDLALVPMDKLIVLCMHIPVEKHTKNNEALYALLQNRNVHIMTGHTHLNYNIIKGSIYEHNHGTVCGAWWTGPICEDGTPSGYGVYHVKGNQLSWQYKATGQPVDYQMKLYANSYSDTEKQVLVNIWNWDPAWRSEYWVDGVSKGALSQTEGFDPLAYKNMLGPDLPKPRGFPEPRLTKHLFNAIVPATAREVKVVATDRFGKTYTSQLSMTS